ncbi:MAG: hypothetical protein FJZ97_06730 [Chloroflexi bacterium]|nr:hypothetical protein [Chloroflexota bacterium]
MDLEFTEGPAAPQPPGAVRFVAVTAEPYADRRRIKLSYEVSPFLHRPSVEIRLLAPDGADLGSITVVDVVGARFSLTAHLRGDVPGATPVRIVSILGYEDLPEVDRRELIVDLPAADPAAPA